MNKTECSCGGSNQSCRWCDGTGMVENKYDQVSLEAMRRESRNKTARQLELQRVILKKQPVLSAIKSRAIAPNLEKTESPKKLIFLPECLVCQARVENLHKHYAKHHQGRRVPDVTDLKNLQLLISEGKCPFCNIKKGRQELLFKHLLEVHNVLNTEVTSRSLIPSSPSIGRQTIKTTFTGDPIKEQPSKLDGQYLTGQMFRDHGQFGSYPLHDSMDNESSA
jgi:hypothetical protein